MVRQLLLRVTAAVLFASSAAGFVFAAVTRAAPPSVFDAPSSEVTRLVQRGQLDEAIAQYRSALPLLPGPQVRLGLARALAAAQRFAEAAEEFEAVRALPEGDVPGVRRDLALTHLLAARATEDEAQRARHLDAARGHALNARARGVPLEPELCAALGLPPEGAPR